ncbi:tetratricopeptide repeat protein [Anabaena sp. CCY 0017]|uniref:tetratricopeptide repeat protein n=1 Tax=Anabaena sp. CCY 0017 TaxID=3103866 RepID=UPI0039C6B6DF
MNSSNLLEEKLAGWHDAIANHPHEPKAYIQRGMVYFQLADIQASIADFDIAEKLDPRLTPYLWQRGLSYYYVAKFAEGAKQFEIDLTVNFQDVEETVWRYLCIAQVDGVTAARQTLLEVKNDPRLVMQRVYDLYAGRCSTDDLLQLGNDHDQRAKFYSYFYVGLYFEAEKQVELARRYINQAVTEKIDDYMWHVAMVHQNLRSPTNV